MMKGVGKIKAKVNLSCLCQTVKDEFSGNRLSARKDEALRKTLGRHLEKLNSTRINGNNPKDLLPENVVPHIMFRDSKVLNRDSS